MTDQPHTADQILGADWRDPAYLLFERAWIEHPKRELLDELAAERDADGEPLWQVHQLTENDIVIYVLRPADDNDPRGSVHIYALHTEVLKRELSKAPAIVAEHDDDCWRP
jgi:hypothetical protein